MGPLVPPRLDLTYQGMFEEAVGDFSFGPARRHSGAINCCTGTHEKNSAVWSKYNSLLGDYEVPVQQPVQ